MGLKLSKLGVGSIIAWILVLIVAFSDAPTFAKLLGFAIVLKGDFELNR